MQRYYNPIDNTICFFRYHRDESLLFCNALTISVLENNLLPGLLKNWSLGQKAVL